MEQKKQRSWETPSTIIQNLICVLLLAFTIHNTANAQATLTIAPKHISGQPGDEQLITITVQDANKDPMSGVAVHFTLHDRTGFFSPTSTVTDSDGIAKSLLTLPIRSATIFVRADANPTVLVSMDVRVTSVPHRFVKVSGDNQKNAPATRLRSPFVVRVEDINDYALPGKWVNFSVVSGGGSLSTTTAQTNLDGEAQTTLTLGPVAGKNIVEVRVRDVPPVRFHATAAAIPAKLIIASGTDQIGMPNKRLTAPLVVQVVDNNRHGVENVAVTFSLTEGSGRIIVSRARTDKDGFARTYFIPKSRGTISVQAEADTLSPVTFRVQVGERPDKVVGISGDNQKGVPGSRLAKPFVVEVQDAHAKPIAGITVNFSVVVGGGRVSAVTAITNANGRAQTYLTLGSEYGANSVKASTSGVFGQITFRATSEARVLIPAARRPSMYWIDAEAGTLHRLVGAKVENLAPSVQNATSLAVDVAAGKLYWTEQTSNRTGSIQRSDLDGRNVQLLKRLRSVPHGIAVDTMGKKIYWANSRGRIQRLNVEGNQNFDPNFITGLDAPMDIALDTAGGKVYWTEGGGRIRSANMKGDRRNIRNVATRLQVPVNMVIAGGKVYWIERTGERGGRIRRIGTNAKNFEDVATLRSLPRGIAVDTTGRKLYWTNAQGRIQRANINGRQIQNVVTGLIAPTDLVIIEQVAETTAMAPAASETRPDETVLLANHPNPFNPETWIPYHLSDTSDVRITLYDGRGVVIRLLELGHQAAGYYVGRSRAAYWDGRNALGERVASGVYFYQLETDTVSLIRKMVVVK